MSLPKWVRAEAGRRSQQVAGWPLCSNLMHFFYSQTQLAALIHFSDPAPVWVPLIWHCGHYATGALIHSAWPAPSRRTIRESREGAGVFERAGRSVEAPSKPNGSETRGPLSGWSTCLAPATKQVAISFVFGQLHRRQAGAGSRRALEKTIGQL